MRPGEYRVVLAQNRRYTSRSRVGDSDIFNTPLRFVGGESSGLELVISPNVALLKVPWARAQVVRSPHAIANAPSCFVRSRRIRPALHDFERDSGDYTLAAWDSIEPFSFFDPGLMRMAEKGKTVQAEEPSSRP